MILLSNFNKYRQKKEKKKKELKNNFQGNLYKIKSVPGNSVTIDAVAG